MCKILVSKSSVILDGENNGIHLCVMRLIKNMFDTLEPIFCKMHNDLTAVRPFYARLYMYNPRGYTSGRRAKALNINFEQDLL